MRVLAATCTVLALMAGPALSDEDDIIQIESDADFQATAERLVTAIENAGAKVLAQIDHGAGAKSVDMDIGDSQLIVFGNPKAGTPAMIENRLAGLYLPLKILVYEAADGKIWVAYDDVTDQLGGLNGLDDDSPTLQGFGQSLDALSRAAAGK